MSFALLALICLVALLGPLLSLVGVVRLPVIVSELAVGIVLGTTGFRLVDPTDPTLSFLASIGFALIMFVAGTHVPVRNEAMRPGLLRGLTRAAAVGLLAVPAGLIVARLFGTDHGLVYAVLFASSSAGLILPALADTPVTSSSGLEMLAQIAVADAACIVALPLAMAPNRAGMAALGALAVILAGAVLFVVLRWLEASGARKRVHRLSESQGLAVELRVTLTLLFALAALATVSHVSVMLAGFVFGIAVAGVGEPRRLAHQTFAITEGLLGPIFFVWLGASLNMRTLAQDPSSIALGLVLGLVAVLVHAAVAVTGQPWPLASVTAGQLGVPVGAAALAQGDSGFAHGEPTAVLLGALVTIAVVTWLTPRVTALVR